MIEYLRENLINPFISKINLLYIYVYTEGRSFLNSGFPFANIKSEIILGRNKINFLLCESCFWCASYFNGYRKEVGKCPTCGRGNVESMPISNDDIYTFNYDPKHVLTTN